MAYTSREKLGKIRANHKDEKLVFCSGSFDLIHGGHALFFEDCKKHGDILVVMIASDKVLKQNKGAERPIINQYVRLKLIDSLKPVDYCLLDETLTPDMHPLSIIDSILEELQPDIYVINEDAFDIPYREKLAAKHGVRLVILKREAPPEFEGISSTQIVEKLKRLGK